VRVRGHPALNVRLDEDVQCVLQPDDPARVCERPTTRYPDQPPHEFVAGVGKSEQRQLARQVDRPVGEIPLAARSQCSTHRSRLVAAGCP
jgi:hypothetical protein